MKNIKILLLVLCASILSCKAEPKKEIAFTKNEAPAVKEHYIKVALLLDTSNSMDGLIDQAKAQLWEIVNELSYAKCKTKRPNLEIALYEYGNDNLNARSGYLRKITPFTQDLDEISKELFSLSTNGGSEYCGTVIKASLDHLDWGNNDDDLKMIFIAGNEPFTQGKVNYRDAASEAKEKGIVVNTIFCGDHRHGVDSKWQDGATLTYGDYISINHNQETVHVSSPYDDVILQLNIQLNGTYIPYGNHDRKKIALQAEQDANASGYSKANAVSRVISKGSHLYKNSTWDLVDAESEETFDYDAIKKEHLPKTLQEKSKAELKKYIEKQRNERARIKTKIASLNKDRRAYIALQKDKNTNELEGAMVNALKRQALKKDFTWD